MAFLRLIRYKNLFMVLLTMILTKYSLIDNYIGAHVLSHINFGITCFSILCLTAAGYIVNDIVDIKADVINKPKKVYVGSSISVQNAWILYIVLNVIGLLTCAYVIYDQGLSYDYLWVYLATISLLYTYSISLKKLPLMGNILISIFCAAIIYVLYLLDFNPDEKVEGFWNGLGKVFGNIGLFLNILFYMVFSFLGTLIREMIKDIEDIDGDYNMQMKTLPILIGRRRARNVVIGISLLFIFILIMTIKSFLDHSDGILLGIYLMLFTLIPSLYFTYHLWSAKSKQQFHKLSTVMKLILFFGILSMILFTFA